MLGVNIWKQWNQWKVICWWFAVHELETTLQTNGCRNIYCQFIFTKIALKLEKVKTVSECGLHGGLGCANTGLLDSWGGFDLSFSASFSFLRSQSAADQASPSTQSVHVQSIRQGLFSNQRPQASLKNRQLARMMDKRPTVQAALRYKKVRQYTYLST